MERGEYPDLTTIGRGKKSRRKKPTVPDFMVDIIKREMYKKDQQISEQQKFSVKE